MNKSTILTVILLVTAFALGSIAPQSGYDQFQKALSKERVEGNLKEAIPLYQKVIDGTKDESLAAKAQLRIGICYEKMGSQEARKAYQRLIAAYPGQKEEVALARERLANLARVTEPSPRQPVFRKIRAPFHIPQWSGGCLSPDGRTLAFGSQNFIWTVPIPGKVDPELSRGTEQARGNGRDLGPRPDMVRRRPLDCFQPGFSACRRRIHPVQSRRSLHRCHPRVRRGPQEDCHSSMGCHARGYEP